MISEKLAEELVQMFVSETNLKVFFSSSQPQWGIFHFIRKIIYLFVFPSLKLSDVQRLLVMELCSIGSENFSQVDRLKWSDHFYVGEFDDLRICDSNSNEVLKQLEPKVESCNSQSTTMQSNSQLERNVLQVLCHLLYMKLYV